MKSFMWVITTIVLSTATILTATTEDNNESNVRQARFSKGEIPLLIIRPVQRPSVSTQHYSRVPVAQSRVSYVSDDMSMLGSILPQLGLDPNLFSAYPLGGTIGGQPKKYLFPIQQNEIHKYHYKPNIQFSFKEPDYKANYAFNYAPPQHLNTPKVAPLISSYAESNDQLNQNERYLDKPLFIPTHNLPSEISEEAEELYSKPLNIINSPEPSNIHTFQTHRSASIQYHPNNNNNNNNNYKQEKYFEPKPIDFNFIKTKEELVIGKPTAPVNLHSTNTGYKSTDAIKEHNFYIPKHENTASFKVKSKTDNVKFVPDYVSKFSEKPVLQSSVGQQKNYNKTSLELFKQTPKVEYFIPKEQETAAVKVSSDTEEYYKKFETDEYFLPKREPAYHKMQELYKNKPSKTTTEQPFKTEVPESYSFMINDDGFSDIHIQDHVYAEPEQLYYGYDHEGSEENHSIENNYAQTSFYPSNHKEFDSKLSALDYVQSSIKSNLNNLFDDYENKKTKISSTYKKEDFTAQPELSFGPFIFSTTSSPSTSEPLKLTEYKDTSYYFAKSSDDHEELNTYYSTLKPFQQHETTPKTTYVRPSFSLKATDVRPIYETFQEEHAINKQVETRYENDYKEPIPPGKLYLKERESDHYENEVSTIFPKLLSTVTPPTTELPIVLSTKFPNKFTTPKITTYKARYSPTSRKTTTVSPRNVSSTTYKLTKLETTTPDSGVNLLSGIACERQCIRNTVSQEYDPVCGSDGKTYSNKGKLRCTRTCGQSELHVKHYGGCGHK